MTVPIGVPWKRDQEIVCAFVAPNVKRKTPHQTSQISSIAPAQQPTLIPTLSEPDSAASLRHQPSLAYLPACPFLRFLFGTRSARFVAVSTDTPVGVEAVRADHCEVPHHAVSSFNRQIANPAPGWVSIHRVYECLDCIGDGHLWVSLFCEDYRRAAVAVFDTFFAGACEGCGYRDRPMSRKVFFLRPLKKLHAKSHFLAG